VDPSRTAADPKVLLKPFKYDVVRWQCCKDADGADDTRDSPDYRTPYANEMFVELKVRLLHVTVLRIFFHANAPTSIAEKTLTELDGPPENGRMERRIAAESLPKASTGGTTCLSRSGSVGNAAQRWLITTRSPREKTTFEEAIAS
jgi:hypothetical protein